MSSLDKAIVGLLWHTLKMLGELDGNLHVL